MPAIGFDFFSTICYELLKQFEIELLENSGSLPLLGTNPNLN